MNLTKEEALTRIRDDETRVLTQTRLNKIFDKIFKNADELTLWKCKYRKADVVFYTLFPEWYEQTQMDTKCRSVLMANGNTKAGMKMLGAGPELSEELLSETDFKKFYVMFMQEMEERILTKNWHTEKVDFGLVHTIEQMFHENQNKISIADRRNDLEFLLTVEKAITKKGEYPGLFEVMEKRGYDHVADAYFLNIPREQRFALCDWYESKRVEQHLPQNEAMDFAFKLNRLIREEEGIFMEDELQS